MTIVRGYIYYDVTWAKVCEPCLSTLFTSPSIPPTNKEPFLFVPDFILFSQNHFHIFSQFLRCHWFLSYFLSATCKYISKLSYQFTGYACRQISLWRDNKKVCFKIQATKMHRKFSVKTRSKPKTVLSRIYFPDTH